MPKITRADAPRCWPYQPERYPRTPEEEIMEPDILINAISTLGFPIVVAAAMFWKMNQQDKDHKEENAKLTEAINNNTLTIQKLIDKLDN